MTTGRAIGKTTDPCPTITLAFNGGGIGYATIGFHGHASARTNVRVNADGRAIPHIQVLSPDGKALHVAFPLIGSESYRFALESPPGSPGSLTSPAPSDSHALNLGATQLRWLSRINWRMRRRECAATQNAIAQERAAGQSLEFIQLFDWSSHENVVRFAVNVIPGTPDDEPKAFGPKGDPLAIEPIELEHFSANGYETHVYSCRLPKSAIPLVIAYGPNLFWTLTTERAEELRRRRDEAMVNPAIDERYPDVANKWATANEPRDTNALIASFERMPTISIVCPLYNTPEHFLSDMLESVQCQSYPHWELILINSTPHNERMRTVLDACDDPRVHELKLDYNRGIVGNTNAGIAVATGDWIAFLDHDDMLAPHALLHYVAWMNAHPADDLLYCDEDSFTVSGEPHFSPLLKPDFNRDLLYTHNYIIHFLAVKREIVERTARSGSDVEGVQDYDLLLKAIDAGAHIGHVPHVLYYWRAHEGSTNGGAVQAKPESEAAGARALAHHFERRQLDVTVNLTDIPFVYRTSYRCDKALEQATAIVVAHEANACLHLLDQLQSLRLNGCLRVVVACHESLASTLSNHAHADGIVSALDAAPYASLVNTACQAPTSRPLAIVISDAVSLDDASCLETLLAMLQRDEVGVCAAKLFYRDGLVQHAGLCVRQDGSLGHLNQNFIGHMGGGYHGFAECDCDYSATGPDLFAFRIETLAQCSQFADYGADELATVADFCFKVRAAGKLAVVTPRAHAVVSAPVMWPERPQPANDTSVPGPAEDAGTASKLRTTWPDAARKEALANPLLTYERSYPQLNANPDGGTAMSNTPKVSVILPIYNAQPYLQQCLESIRSQTMGDFEALCVNDGSTDDSCDVIRAFAAADRRFRLLDKPNGGYGQTLNFGLERATGEFVAIVEPDDFIHPQMFEQLCALANLGGEPADIVKGSYWEFFDGTDGFHDQLDEPGLAKEMDPLPCVVDLAQDNTLLLHHPSIWSALYRRSFLQRERIRFVEPKGAGWADNPFFLETMIAAKRIVWVPRAFYYYRQTNPSASSLLKDFRIPFERLDDMFAIVRNRNAAQQVKAALYQRAFFYIESIVGEFGFDEADPELQALINKTLSQMEPAIVYESDSIRLEWVTFYESRMALCSVSPDESSFGFGDDPSESDAYDTAAGWRKTAEAASQAPIITFIIPMRNDAAHASQSIDSLLKLPIDSFEVLLVDCGTSDRTGDICAHATVEDPRFRFVCTFDSETPQNNSAEIDAAIAQARGTYLYIHNLKARFSGSAFARALLQAAETDIDIMLLDERRRFAAEALGAAGNASALDEWGTGNERNLITRPFAPEKAASFALNCGYASSHSGLYRTALLHESGIGFGGCDVACDRLLLSRALAKARTAAYMAAEYVEWPFEPIRAIPFYLDARPWRINEPDLTLPGTLRAAEDALAQHTFSRSALNLVLEAFAADLKSRWSVETLSAYVDENLERVSAVLDRATDQLWFHDDEAYSDFSLLQQSGLQGFCTYHYLEQFREAEVRMKLLTDMEQSRTYKLGKAVTRTLKTVMPASLIARIRTSKAAERG